MALLVTACSKQKCVAGPPSAAALGQGTVDQIASDWIGMLGASPKRYAAADLYRGRGHRLAVSAARQAGVSHLIMSAGLGFVQSDADVPAYSLTVAAGQNDSILPHLPPGVGVSDWWAAIERHSPWARGLEGSGTIIVALPLRYLQMFVVPFSRLTSSSKARVRLISGAASSAVPSSLRPFHLPYDSRFNGPDSPHRGTDADFHGRAASHFLSILNAGPDLDLGLHQALVEQELSSMRLARRRQGRMLPDEAIVDIIHSQLELARRGSGDLLRGLRRDLGIACEQGRFRRLYLNVLAEHAA